MSSTKYQLIPIAVDLDYPQVAISWQEVVDTFLVTVDLRVSTLESYRRRLRQWVVWLDENNINHPHPSDLIQFKKDILQRCSSSLTCSNYLTAIRSLLRWCHRRKIYPNISEEVRSPQRGRVHRKDALELSQLQELLGSIDRTNIKGKRDYALCRLLASTGPRGIEIWRANVEDIVKEKNRWILRLQGKGREDGDKSEFVVLMPSVLEALEDYLLHRNCKNKNTALFTSLSTNYKGRLSTKSIRGIVKSRLRAIGIDTKRLTCHSMRHTAVTFSLLCGCGLQETKELARHASIDTTLMYAHNLKLFSNPAFESVDAMIESKEE